MWLFLDVTLSGCDYFWMWLLLDANSSGCDYFWMWLLLDVTTSCLGYILLYPHLQWHITIPGRRRCPPPGDFQLIRRIPQDARRFRQLRVRYTQCSSSARVSRHSTDLASVNPKLPQVGHLVPKVRFGVPFWSPKSPKIGPESWKKRRRKTIRFF